MGVGGWGGGGGVSAELAGFEGSNCSSHQSGLSGGRGEEETCFITNHSMRIAILINDRELALTTHPQATGNKLYLLILFYIVISMKLYVNEV